MYYDNSQIELKRSQLNPSQCRHFHTFMSVCWHGIAIDAYKLPSSLTDIGQLFRHFKQHKWQLTKQKYNILSILFESKKAFATFEVNIYEFSVQPITKFFILLQKISNYSHIRRGNLSFLMLCSVTILIVTFCPSLVSSKH